MAISRLYFAELMLKYGGGGHMAAGTCQVPHETSQRVLSEVIESLKEQKLCEV